MQEHTSKRTVISIFRVHCGNYRSKGYQLSISTRQKYDPEDRHKLLSRSIRYPHIISSFGYSSVVILIHFLLYSSLMLLTLFDRNLPAFKCNYIFIRMQVFEFFCVENIKKFCDFNIDTNRYVHMSLMWRKEIIIRNMGKIVMKEVLESYK